MYFQTRYSRRSRTRKLGALAMFSAALLTPAGKIMMGLATAAAIGFTVTLLRAPSTPSSQPPSATPNSLHAAFGGAPSRQPARATTTQIKANGESLPIILTEGFQANPASAGTGSPPTFIPLGLPGGASSPSNPPSQSGAPVGGQPAPLPGFGPYAPPFSQPGQILPPTGAPQIAQSPITPTGGGSTPPVLNNAPQAGPPGPLTGPGQSNPPITSRAPLPSSPPGSVPPRTAAPGGGLTKPPAAQHPVQAPPVDDPLNPPLPTLQFGPLRTAALPPAQIQAAHRATVPEPSVLGLMLLGFAALVWNERRQHGISKPV